MESRQEYKKFVEYKLDLRDTKNPIKPNNYINNSFEYNGGDLWPILNNYDGFVSTGVVQPELQPVVDYMIQLYKQGIDLLEIFHLMAESYVKNLDPIHLGLVCEAIHYGRQYNNIRTTDSDQVGAYRHMFRHFAKLISESSKSRWMFTVSNYNEDCEAIYVKHKNIFSQIQNLEI